MKREEVWFDRNGEVHKVSEMEVPHLQNAYSHLIRRIVSKVNDLDASRLAYDDNYINAYELDIQEELIRKDLMYLDKDIRKIKNELKARGEL